MGASEGPLEAIWRPLRGLLGGSWGPLGGLLGELGGNLSLKLILERFGCSFEGLLVFVRFLEALGGPQAHFRGCKNVLQKRDS